MSAPEPLPTAAADPLALLKQTPVLGSLHHEGLRALASESRVLELCARQVLWKAGEAACQLGIVSSGRLKATRRQQRREVVIEVLGPRDLVGDVALSLRATYQFDVTCLRRARVLLVPAALLRRELAGSLLAQTALAGALAAQVLRLARRVEALAAGTVEQRLARVLVGLADRFGEPFSGGVLVPVSLRRRELASLAATTVESTSRRLSVWSALHIVQPQPAGYVVRDLAALRRIVER